MSPQPSYYLKLTQTLFPIFVGKHFGEHESEILSHTYVFSYLCIAPAGNLEIRKRCSIESRLNVAYFCCVQENKWGVGLIENRIMLNVHVAKNSWLKAIQYPGRCLTSRPNTEMLGN